MSDTMWVLMKSREPGRDSGPHDEADSVRPHCVCVSLADIEGVIQAIANHSDNRKYQMRSDGKAAWRIGPTEDEGFFGHRPMRFWAVEVKVRTPSRQPAVR